MRKGVRRLLIAGGLVLTLAGVAQAQTLVPCEATPTVRQALRNLPLSTGDAQPDRAARLEALRALLKRFPNDVYVHERYQDTAMYPTVQDRDAVIAEYRALAAKRPKDAACAYLAARALIGSRTKEALPELEKLASTVPPARLALVRIYQSTSFKDAAKARQQLEAFGNACPTSPGAASYLRSIEPSDFLTKNTEHLRTILQGRKDIDSVGSYSTLWSLEFRVKPAPEHDAVRKQIAEDLKKLRTIDPGKGTSLYSALQEGYKLTGDKEGARWAAEQTRKIPGAGMYAARSQWYEDHPYPKPTDPPEKRKAYNDALATATADWIRLAPNQPSAWYERVNALASAEGVSASDVEAAGEGLLNAVARNPGQMSFISPVGGSSFALLVANLYATKGVRIDRLSDLVAQGIPELDMSTRIGSWPSDLYPSSSAGEDSNREYSRWYGRLTIADVWIKAKDVARARKTLLEIQTLADDAKPKDAKDAQKQRTYLSRQVDYWRRTGDLAQLEGRKTDAMTYYQNALLARVSPPGTGQKDELAEKARGLWSDIGGSNEGWQAWFTRKELFGGGVPEATAASAWTKIEKTLPEFELADLSGRKWRLTDFKGKPTLVGIWATW
jgi:hypothetical protein